MAKNNVARSSREWGSVPPSPGIPRLPATDNEPGAPEALLNANKVLRGRRWPAPYDRTRHEMTVGDAR